MLLQRPAYEADARILIQEPQSSGGMLYNLGNLPAGLSVLMGAAPQTSAEMEILRSRPVVRAVIGPRGSSEVVPEVGLNLLVSVEDADRDRLWKVYRRKLRGDPEPRPGLEVDVRAWDFPEGFDDAIRVRFLGADEVELSFDRWLDRRGERRSYQPGEELSYHGATFVLRPEGDPSGRTFSFARGDPAKVLEDFFERLTVEEAARGSNVLQVRYVDTEKGRAAEVLNELLRSYIAHNRARKQRLAGRSRELLEHELERVRAELSRAEAELQAFGEEVGPLALPDTAKALVEKLVEVDLEKAKLDLGARSAEDILARIRGGELSAGEIAGLELTALVGNEEVEPLLELLGRRAVLAVELTENHPLAKALEAEIAERLRAIEEVIASQIRRDRAIAKDLEGIVATFQEEMSGFPRAQVELIRFKRRVEAFGQIYLFLLAQIQEATAAETSAVPDVDVVEWAVEPLRRKSPRVKLGLGVGLLAGLLASAWLVFALELRRPVTTAAQLEAGAGAPCLGVVPSGPGRRRRGPALVERPGSAEAQEIRAVYAALENVRESSGDAARALGFVSLGRGEGRAAVAAGLACAYAQAGRSVLAVDADLRRHALGDLLGAARSPGLGQVLSGGAAWADVLVGGPVPGLSVLPAGSAGERDPGELLGGEGLARLLDEAAGGHDLVLCDAPALEEGADALLLGSKLQGVVLVTRGARVPEARLREAAARLRRAGADPIGAVLVGSRV